MPSIFLH
jgi:hypothetical protein